MQSRKVTFADYGPNIASSRLRAAIPQRELAKLGVEQGRDVLVYGKHVVPMDQVKQFGKAVYDVCDDHFHTCHEAYYRQHVANADLITVNSEAMREIVSHETGRDSVVIPDPYESEEKPAGMGKGLFWFGHQSNLKTVEPYADLNIKTLTGDEWSRERQLEELAACEAVVLPTDERTGKSANRLIEAVRNGRFVVAGYLPAHEEFKPYMWIGDIRQGVEWVRAYPHKAIQQVTACQEYIRDTYSPERIGRLWFEALEPLCQ